MVTKYQNFNDLTDFMSDFNNFRISIYAKETRHYIHSSPPHPKNHRFYYL